MTIEIDKASGFCFGVTTAITKAEQQLHETGRLYCLGDIVHNSNEVERLRQSGLKTITHEQMAQLHNVSVLLRAHGEPPSTYRLAEKNNIRIIDATCPVVLKLQQRIAASYALSADNPAHPQIVIYGKRGHAEVNGLVGQTHGTALVIEDESELDKINFGRPVVLYSQTTKSLQGFQRIVDEIRSRMQPGIDFRSYDTICRSVANRIPQIRHFAGRHELVLFVCGAKSSNGRILFAECRQANANSHLIAGPEEIDPSWLAGIDSVGITGATSTPRWLMARVQDHLNRLQAPTT